MKMLPAIMLLTCQNEWRIPHAEDLVAPWSRDCPKRIWCRHALLMRKCIMPFMPPWLQTILLYSTSSGGYAYAPAITCSGEHTGTSSSSYLHRLKFHNMVITWLEWPEKNCGTLHKQSTGYKAQSSYRAATGLKSRHAPSRSSPEKIASPDKRRSVLDAKPNQEPGMSRERTNQTTIQDTTS